MRREGDFIKVNKWLKPLSWCYGIGVGFRNQLFDLGVLRSRSYDVPIISVGNITVGGSGKTPHVEFLVELLKNSYNVAVLSRGYKRKTSGFVLASNDTMMLDIGDEPYQMKMKFPDVNVAVDENRRRGICKLISNKYVKDIDAIVMDDAYQHRYVKPGINILLIDYHRLIIHDSLLPAGRLREPQEGKARADMVIVTKCPRDLKPMEYRVITKALNLFAYQKLYFTTLDYASPQPLFDAPPCELAELKDHHVLLLTGIALPEQMKADLLPYCKHIKQMKYRDHHQFTKKDVGHINKTFATMDADRKIIITTEKDAVRLHATNGLSDEVRQNIYSLPINVVFMQDKEEEFNNKILDYVQKNSRNSILAKAKDDNKP